MSEIIIVSSPNSHRCPLNTITVYKPIDHLTSDETKHVMNEMDRISHKNFTLRLSFRTIHKNNIHNEKDFLDKYKAIINKFKLCKAQTCSIRYTYTYKNKQEPMYIEYFILMFKKNGTVEYNIQRNRRGCR